MCGAGKPGGWDLGAGPAAQHVPDGISDFTPRGVLVAHMAEHQHSVNSLAVSRNRCHWFASASSDGTVKLWGCGKEGVHIDKVAPSRPLADPESPWRCMFPAVPVVLPGAAMWIPNNCPTGG